MKHIILLSIILVVIASIYYFFYRRETYKNSIEDIIDNLQKEINNQQKNEAPSIAEQQQYQETTNKNIDQQFKDLKELEEKCSSYYEDINKNYEEKKRVELENMYEELEVQDMKIRELEKIVNIFRNQYLVRRGITNKCREKNQQKIEKDINDISRLVDEGKLKNQNVKLNVSFAEDENGEQEQDDSKKGKCKHSNKMVDIGNKKFSNKVDSLTDSQIGKDLRSEAVNLSLSKYI